MLVTDEHSGEGTRFYCGLCGDHCLVDVSSAFFFFFLKSLEFFRFFSYQITLYNAWLPFQTSYVMMMLRQKCDGLREKERLRHVRFIYVHVSRDSAGFCGSTRVE